MTELLRLGQMTLNLGTGVIEGGSGVTLTPTERRFLSHLSPGIEVTDSEILREVWGFGPKIQTRTLATLVYRLRRKLEADPKKPRFLLRSRDGYRLFLDPSTPTLSATEIAYYSAGATDFVGREEELEWLESTLRSPGLVTIVGPGGAGKTRLAIRYAALRGKTHFVDLTLADDRESMARIIAASVGVAAGPRVQSQDLMAEVARTTATDQLIVLDNLEHLIAHAELVDQLSEGGCTILVTSRVALSLPSERKLELSGLTEEQAVQVLAARAGLLTPEDRSTLSEIGGQLDRLPLALELAAVRLRLQTPTELLGRLRKQLDALRSAEGGRHSTMRACVKWSRDLLSVPEREALGQLCLFASSFTAAAAEQVLQVSGDPLDALQGLLDHNLIYRSSGRLKAWQAVRELSLEDLASDPRRPEHVARFAAWAAHFGKGHADQLRECWTIGVHTELVDETDNLRRAFELGHRVNPHAATVALHSIPYATLASRGLDRAIQLCNTAVQCTEDDRHLKAESHLSRSRMLRLSGQWQSAGEDAEVAVNLMEDLPERQAIALGEVALLANHAGSADKAEAILQRARRLAQESGAPVQGVYDGNLGALALQRGDFDAAEQHLSTALDLLARGGSPWNIGRFQVNLANVHTNRARPDLAAPYLEQARTQLEVVEDRVALAQLAASHAIALLHAGDLDRARSMALEASDQASAVNLERTQANAHLTLGSAAIESGRSTDAEAELRKAMAIYLRLGLDDWVGIADFYLGRALLIREDLDGARFRLSRGIEAMTSAGRRSTPSYARIHLAIAERDLDSLGRQTIDVSDPVAVALKRLATEHLRGDPATEPTVLSSYARALYRFCAGW